MVEDASKWQMADLITIISVVLNQFADQNATTPSFFTFSILHCTACVPCCFSFYIALNMEKLSGYAIGAAFFIFFGYLVKSTILQYYFYAIKEKTVVTWKLQPRRMDNVGSNAWKWWLPLLNNKAGRAKDHYILASCNLVIASLFALVSTQLHVIGRSYMVFSSIEAYGLQNILFDFFLALTYESVVEYIWHRLMHLRFFYLRFHKLHHFYKSPEPFDDMYIHPLEAFGYYCILYAPPFLFTCHYFSFIAYMIVMGICGVLDHSGIKFALPYVYDTEDHDAHHSKFEVNYGFPFPYIDMLCGTYDGKGFGKKVL